LPHKLHDARPELGGVLQEGEETVVGVLVVDVGDDRLGTQPLETGGGFDVPGRGGTRAGAL
jgi:hypothetical protein